MSSSGFQAPVVFSKCIYRRYLWAANLMDAEPVSRGRCSSSQLTAAKKKKPKIPDDSWASAPAESMIITPNSVATRGLAAMDPPHILVVEDTTMCWKVSK